MVIGIIVVRWTIKLDKVLCLTCIIYELDVEKESEVLFFFALMQLTSAQVIATTLDRKPAAVLVKVF